MTSLFLVLLKLWIGYKVRQALYCAYVLIVHFPSPSKELWPVMDKWIKNRVGNGNSSSPSDIVVAAVLRLIGELHSFNTEEPTELFKFLLTEKAMLFAMNSLATFVGMNKQVDNSEIKSVLKCVLCSSAQVSRPPPHLGLKSLPLV